jgi:hypothetical protein
MTKELGNQVKYISNAHRLPGPVASSVTDIYEHQLFQLNAQGEFEYADGTKRAYPTLNNRYPGAGLGPQGERLEGRDDVSRSGSIAVYKGNYEIPTNQYDKDATYTYGAPVQASTDPLKKGQIALFDTAAASPKWHLVIGYVTKVPADDSDFLRYEGI